MLLIYFDTSSLFIKINFSFEKLRKLKKKQFTEGTRKVHCTSLVLYCTIVASGVKRFSSDLHSNHTTNRKQTIFLSTEAILQLKENQNQIQNVKHPL